MCADDEIMLMRTMRSIQNADDRRAKILGSTDDDGR
jgi:hypothetical protein